MIPGYAPTLLQGTKTDDEPTSFTYLGSEADSPEPLLRPSSATGHEAEMLEGEDPHLGYDAETFPYRPSQQEVRPTCRAGLVEEKGVMGEAVLWRRLDRPGHEYARLSQDGTRWQLTGVAVFQHAQQPCRLDYAVICDGQWLTQAGKVTGWVGDQAVEVAVSVDASGTWRINGTECPEVAGSIDLDLNFSPSTNLLPIRRLTLSRGEEAQVKAAWLRFPGFTLEPLEQIYRRVDDVVYRYESAGGTFVAHLKVNAVGFVTLYPKVWAAE